MLMKMKKNLVKYVKKAIYDNFMAKIQCFRQRWNFYHRWRGSHCLRALKCLQVVWKCLQFDSKCLQIAFKLAEIAFKYLQIPSKVESLPSLSEIPPLVLEHIFQKHTFWLLPKISSGGSSGEVSNTQLPLDKNHWGTLPRYLPPWFRIYHLWTNYYRIRAPWRVKRLCISKKFQISKYLSILIKLWTIFNFWNF